MPVRLILVTAYGCVDVHRSSNSHTFLKIFRVTLIFKSSVLGSFVLSPSALVGALRVYGFQLYAQLKICAVKRNRSVSWKITRRYRSFVIYAIKRTSKYALSPAQFNLLNDNQPTECELCVNNWRLYTSPKHIHEYFDKPNASYTLIRNARLSAYLFVIGRSTEKNDI